jgi:hypothetical protein
MPIPTPPADKSGGYIIGQYSNGTDTHKYRFHVRTFDPATGNYPSPWGAEATIQQTWTAFTTKFLPFYSNAWTFVMKAVYQISSGDPVEVYGLPAPAALVGTGTNNPTAGEGRAFQLNYNFTSNGGGRMRVVMLGRADLLANFATGTVTPTTGGNASDQALVAYLSGVSGGNATTGVCAHDGHLVLPAAHTTWTVNRRLRRAYHLT